MTDILDLYDQAERDGIPVYWFDLESTESLSCQLPDGSCAIAMNPWSMGTTADEKVKLAHELGHCQTGSFYSRYAALDIRRKHEVRADRWAIKKLIPEDELRKAVDQGYQNTWELAEYFGVTEDLIHNAVAYYQMVL